MVSGFAAELLLACSLPFAAILLMIYKLNKRLTIQMADELAERRKQFKYA